ncbi:MAG: energy transducer TonB [Marinilabiliaceae bacterium]|jgi:protein TonB|nr:energy transducer TonB [Marinilabiliaceae bacterium]
MKKNGQNQRTGKILLVALLSLLAGSLVQAQEAEEKVFEEVAVMPIFRDGDVNTFRNWVMQNVKFPEAARKDKVIGRVRAGFIVEKDGSVKKVKIIKGVPEYFDDEVIRVIKSSPKWTPGKNKEGETVRVSFEITVNFELK